MQTENHYTETDLGNVSPNPRGEYDNAAKYEYLDLVSMQGGSYLCIAELGQTITGIAPEAGKNTEHWQCVAIPGNMTPEYTDAYGKVVRLAREVEKDAAKVAEDKQSVTQMETNARQLKEQAEESARQAENSKDSAAGSAREAKKAEESARQAENNVGTLVNGFDTHVAEKTTEATQAVETAKDNAVQAVGRQETASVQAVKDQTTTYITEQKNLAKQELDDKVNQFGLDVNVIKAEVSKEGQKQITNVQEATTAELAKITEKGTEQTGLVTAEGNKQVQAVQTAAQEIIADREQINTNKEEVAQLKEDLSQLSKETATLREDLNALRDGESTDSYNYIGDLPQTPNFRPVYLLASEDTVLTIGENLCSGLESRLIDGSVNPYNGNTVYYTNCIDVVFNDTNGVTFTRNGTIWQNAYLLFAIPAEVGKTYTVSAEYTDAYMRLAETDAIEGNIDLSNFSSYAEVNSNGRYATSLTASKAYVLIQTFTKNNATTTINKVAVTDDGTTAYSESKTINLTGGSYTEYVNTVGELIPAGSVPIGLYQKISSGSGETDLSAVYDYVDEKLETKLDRSGYTESGNLIVNEDGEVMIQEDANEVYVFLGDSIPTFDANTGGDGAIPDYMQKLIGGTWHNLGIGGTTMASYTSSNNTYDMFTFGELADSIASGDFTNQEIGVTNGVGAGSTDYSPSEKVADMKVLDWSMVNTIFAHFGTNDLAYGNSVGGVDDVASKNGTMVASLKYAINKILSTYPTMKIVICGIIYRYADNPSVSSIISANKVIKESCESIGVPYVDLFSKMCVNQSNKDSFLYDGTHPNENGKVRYAECLAKEVF